MKHFNIYYFVYAKMKPYNYSLFYYFNTYWDLAGLGVTKQIRWGPPPKQVSVETGFFKGGTSTSGIGREIGEDKKRDNGLSFDSHFHSFNNYLLSTSIVLSPRMKQISKHTILRWNELKSLIFGRKIILS